MNYTEETFPHNNWYLHFTEEERPVVNNWRINIVKYSNSVCYGNYINWRGGWGGMGRGWGTLITFSDFKKFILKEQEEVVVHQDCSYLIDVLKRHNVI